MLDLLLTQPHYVLEVAGLSCVGLHLGGICTVHVTTVDYERLGAAEVDLLLVLLTVPSVI